MNGFDIVLAVCIHFSQIIWSIVGSMLGVCLGVLMMAWTFKTSTNILLPAAEDIGKMIRMIK